MTYPDSAQVSTADGRVLLIALATVGRYDQSGQLPQQFPPARNVPQRGTTRTSPSPASTRIALVRVDRLTP
jgi:hypothetical protein